jgi:hypothetical protein
VHECPNCERYKASASMWRNEAYRVAGHPLPWSPDEKLLQEALEALTSYDGTNGVSKRKRVLAALRARLEEKT